MPSVIASAFGDAEHLALAIAAVLTGVVIALLRVNRTLRAGREAERQRADEQRQEKEKHEARAKELAVALEGQEQWKNAAQAAATAAQAAQVAAETAERRATAAEQAVTHLEEELRKANAKLDALMEVGISSRYGETLDNRLESLDRRLTELKTEVQRANAKREEQHTTNAENIAAVLEALRVEGYVRVAELGGPNAKPRRTRARKPQAEPE